MRIAVIGNGMVGQRFLEQLVAHGKKGGDCEITVFCEEPRPAYDRVQLTSFFSGKSAKDLNVVPDQFFQEHGVTLRLNDSVLGDRSGEQGGALGALQGSALRQAGARHRLQPLSCRRWRERTAAIASSTAPSRTSRSSPRRRPARRRHGHRRRPARAGGGQGAAGPRARDAHRRVRLAPDGGAARRFRRPAPAPQDRGAGRPDPPAEEHQGNRRRRRAQAQARVRRRHQPGNRPDRLLRRHPAARRAGARAGLAVGERGGIQINSHCQTTNPDIYAIGECALWEGHASSAWSRPATRWRRSRRATCSARRAAVPWRRHEHQAQADGRGRVLDRRRPRQRARRAQLRVHLRGGQGIYKKLVVAEDRKQLLGAILVGDATDYGTLLQMALNPLPLPEHPEELILPAREGKPAKGWASSCCPTRRRSARATT